MKKLLALITALICSFGALAAAGCNAGGGSDDNFVGLYDEVFKIRRLRQNGRKLVDRLFRYSVEIFRLYYRRFYFGRRYVRYRRFA